MFFKCVNVRQTYKHLVKDMEIWKQMLESFILS